MFPVSVAEEQAPLAEAPTHPARRRATGKYDEKKLACAKPLERRSRRPE